jgi:hypothetical protein
MYRYLQLAGMWVRVVLLVITLFACAVFLLWQFGGPWINQFDTFVVKTYNGYYQKRLNRGISEASKDPKQGVVLLEQFLAELSEINKLDRLDRIKREAFKSVVQVLDNEGKTEEALVWAERWVEFDGRDLFAQVSRAKLMRKIPMKIEEGWSLISEWYRKIPNSSLIANEYAEYLVGRGQIPDAFLAAYRAFEKQDSIKEQGWQIFWDTGKNFNAGQMKNVLPSIDAYGKLSLILDVPPGVIRVRIDPPMNSRIILLNPVVIYGKKDQETKYSLLDKPVGLWHMVRTGKTLVTTGGNDPYFYWDISEVKTPGEKIVFSSTVELSPPQVIEKILTQPNLDTVERELINRQELGAAKLFYVLSERQRNLELSSMLNDAFFELFWKNTGENFTSERRVRKPIHGTVKKESFSFEVIIPIAVQAEKLRIDLPDIVGKSFTFKTIELVGDGWAHKVDLNKINDGLSHMVERQSTSFEVIGIDPYFEFFSASGDKIIQSVVIRGEAL